MSSYSFNETVKTPFPYKYNPKFSFIFTNPITLKREIPKRKALEKESVGDLRINTAKMAASKLMIVLVVMVAASFQLQTTVAQTRHVVGGALGWTIPPAGAYTTWASQQTFTVGDSLFFNFTTGAHDVAEVSQAAYGPCTTASAMSTVMTGPATIILNRPGNYYYICTFGTHCQIGQKLTINVAAASSGTPPSTSGPAPAGSPMSPPPPPAGNASPSFTAVVPATFLAAALAFFY